MALRRAAVSGGLGGVGAALLLAALVVAFLRPDAGAAPSVLAAAALACLAAAAFTARRELATLLRRRQARRGGLALLHAGLLLGLAATLAFLAERHPLRRDLTHDRRHSLTADARRVLDALPEGAEPLELFGVDTLLPGAPAGAAGQALGPLLSVFDRASTRVAVRFVVAEREPALVRELGVTRPPAVVVRYRPPGEAPRVRIVEALTEGAVAAAIEQALLGELPRALVVTGHGELSLQDPGPLGFLVAAQDLAGDNFAVQQLVLADGAVPEDAAILIVPGPQVDLLEGELAALRAHAARGGRVLVLLGPSETDDPLVGWRDWLREDWGVDARRDIVADLDGLTAGGDLLSLVIRPDLSLTHPVVRDRRQLVVLPVSRTVRKASYLPDWTTVTVLLRSGPRSWTETDPATSPRYDEGVDEKGPLPLALAAVRDVPGGGRPARLVVIGSARFSSNVSYFQQGNPQLLLNAVAWLTERDDVLEARRGGHRDGTVVVAASQFRLIALAMLVLPAVVLLGGVAQWAHRRRL